MTGTLFFSPGYREARRLLLDTAARMNIPVKTRILGTHSGAGGEVLATDMLWIGESNPRGVIMVSSGLHGVEGFAGSAAQLALLAQLDETPPPPGIAVAIVHALNPYGFSYLRRTNEDNVDLNRNFIDFTQDLPAAPDYESLHPAVAPPHWCGPSRDAADQALAKAWATMGPRDFQQAVCQGQHVHADGLFYGGTEPAWSNNGLRALIADLPANLELLVHIDIHTGLGPYGVGELLYTLEPDTPAAAMAREWYGTLGLNVAGWNTSSATQVHGTMNNAFRLARAQALSLSIEFGTVAFQRMFEALRNDNLLRLYGIDDEDARRAAELELRACFNPDDDWWRQAVLDRCDEVLRCTLARVRHHLGIPGSGSPG